MSLQMRAILLSIGINRKLVTIDPILEGAILNLFVKTGNDYSLAVISVELLYQLRYILLQFRLQLGL